jgi:hypothetical protein
MRKFFLLAAVAVASVLSLGTSADAAFRMRVESGTTTGPGVVITDGALGNETGIADGGAGTDNLIIVTSVGGLPGFAVSVTTGTSSPFLAAPTFFEAIDLNNVSINASGEGTLRMILVRSDFGAATPDGLVGFRVELGGTLSAPAGSTITFDSYGDDSNTIPDLGVDVNPVGALAPVTGIPALPTITHSFGVGAFSAAKEVNFIQSGTFSVYTVVTVNFTGAGSVSFNNTVGTSPAPAGLLLALTAAPVLGVGAWIRRRRSGVAA